MITVKNNVFLFDTVIVIYSHRQRQISKEWFADTNRIYTVFLPSLERLRHRT